MRAEIAVTSLLNAATDITDVVSTRIFPNVVPQGEKGNAITYHIGRLNSFDSKNTFNDYHQASVQISVFCASSDVAGKLIEDIRTALERKKGTYGTDTTVTVDNIFFDNMEDMGFLDDVEKYHKVIEFNMFLR